MTDRPEDSSWFQRWVARPTPVLAWAVALLLGGAWMATQVPLEWVPTTNLPEVRGAPCPVFTLKSFGKSLIPVED